jgi:integrase
MIKPSSILDESPHKGILIRKFKHQSSIEIYFSYRGVRCRELLRMEPTKKNLADAANMRSAILRDISLNKFKYSEYFPESSKVKIFEADLAKNILIEELLQKFLSQTEHQTKNGNLSPSTHVGYRKIINGKLIPSFGELNVKELSPIVIKEWIYSQGCGAKTIRNNLSILRVVLDDALNDGIIASNPLSQIAVSRLIKQVSESSDYVIEPFTEQERNLIISNAEGQIRNLLQFGFWSGLRTSELLALEWSDIDLDNETIHVNKAKVCNITKGTKTKAGTRKIMVLPQAQEALRNQFEYTGYKGEHVFNNPNTNQPWSNSNKIADAWRKVLTLAGVKYRNAYQMRHTYASMLLSNGENPWWLATQMGHVDVEMIFKHYGKWIPQNGNQHGYNLVGKY